MEKEVFLILVDRLDRLRCIDRLRCFGSESLKNVVQRGNFDELVFTKLLTLSDGSALAEAYISRYSLAELSSIPSKCLIEFVWICLQHGQSAVLERIYQICDDPCMVSTSALARTVNLRDYESTERLLDCRETSEFDVYTVYRALVRSRNRVGMLRLLLRKGLYPDDLNFLELFQTLVPCDIGVIQGILERIQEKSTLKASPDHTYQAVVYGNLSVLKSLLLDGFALNGPECMVNCCFPKTVQYLCTSCGIDINTSWNGVTILSQACRFWPHLVGKFLKMGAVLQKETSFAVLYNAAVSTEPKKLLRLLIQHGANINSHGGPSNRSVVHGLMEDEANSMIAEFLIREGANFNTIDINGETPLITAVKARNYTMARYLVRAGACVDASDSQGNTADDYAQLSGLSGLDLVVGVKRRRQGRY